MSQLLPEEIEVIEKNSAEFLGVTLEEAKDENNKELNRIFNTTVNIGISIRKNLKQGTIKLINQNDDFESFDPNDMRGVFYISSLHRLRTEFDKLKHETVNN